MKISRHRLIGLPASALLITAVGCSSADDSADVAVPSTSPAVTKLCQNLDSELPRTVDGLSRNDPEPRSVLTAGWGSPVIILRCGVARPSKMVDPKVAEGRDPDAVAGGVNGVDWLQEERDGGYLFTSANRRAYVEVRVPEGQDSAGVLIDLAPAVKSAIPEGIAD
ncbi:DUF3515 family protein [Streptomyces sp. NPDC047706]|uniref:DUF3515 family protein n=1 Tax=Streptomyces sp. NPDC047706 TaxID=3365486 RepID=UPI0037214679